MTKHAPTPWQAFRVLKNCWTIYEPASDGAAICNLFDKTGSGFLNAEANAAFIVTAVNNHEPMLKSLKHCAGLFDALAQTLDRWAIESRSGGWSTHQVEDNRCRADDCRRYAASIRQALRDAGEASTVSGDRSADDASSEVR